ncbi:aldehyde dehydrogenase family protein [Methanoplanus sp. FWC-SCC4]|uniref:Aldehyde dehydrogenase family protein n=2 Tax=Methanochimaera problematica TaxID=2609417 RepID=A0AA97FA82_9EURY|nr:aldehyde dehydrogenase family protein [Methanoplanus sp. FWC-SCC4]
MTSPLEFIVGGDLRKSDETQDVIYPYTNRPYRAVFLADEKDAEDALECSAQGFLRTKKLSGYQKKEILDKLAGLIEQNQKEFVEILIKEGGKVRDLATAEVSRAVETLKISAEESVRLGGSLIPLDRTKAGEGHIGITRRFPVGPVLAITPFNYPLNLACHKIGPAIAAGNSFILKPASKTPISALLFGKLIIEAGYPKDAVNVIPCKTSIAEKMVSDERIRFLSFTGSPDVGWYLKSIAPKKKVALELGGNAAVIVHNDADIEIASRKIAVGALANAGQVCISVQRIFVQNDIYKKFIDALKSSMERIEFGDPEESGVILGPMISEDAASFAYEKVDESVFMGANITMGGSISGARFPPTILEKTTPEMSVNSTEIFAPVVSVRGYDEFEEALKYANESKYGLQTGIFTRDIGRVIKAFENAETGGVIINEIPSFRVDCMPYGGIKMSGTGREGPRYAIMEMTEEKLLVLNNLQ